MLEAFGLDKSLFSFEALKKGHIHTTSQVTEKSSGKTLFLLQQFNKAVFKRPENVAGNIEKVSACLDKFYPDEPHLRFITPLTGEKHFHQTATGELYRLLQYESGTQSFDRCENENMARETAFAFGRFAQRLQKLHVHEIIPAIPGFHDLNLRWWQFLEAEKNSLNNEILKSRRRQASALCTKAHQFESIVHRAQKLVESGKLPLRIVHADAKLSNVLFKNGKTYMVIDWDTIMPGYFWSDLGDLLRSTASKAAEDEADIDKIFIEPGWKEAIEEGWKNGMGESLSETELANLDIAGPYMIYMQALRFLSDWLQGDVYYHLSYPLQNFNRASSQFALLERIMEV
jgi:thiamine kinase-like enzyme